MNEYGVVLESGAVRFERLLPGPVERVWSYLTESEKRGQWLASGVFDLRVGGNWILTMHGPEKGNYENSSVFKTVLPNKLISWERKSQPLFDMEIAFEKLEENKTQISFKMMFATAEECEKMRKFVEPKNEENFNRLEREIKTM